MAEGTTAISMPQGTGQHPINWVEFVARDHERATAFFSNVFGWKFNPFIKGYSTFMDHGGYGGGVNSAKPEQPLRSFVYIQVDNVDDALAQCAAAGGEAVVPKIVIDPQSGGGSGFFRDPAGLLMGLADIQMPELPSPTPFGHDKPADGAICCVELYGGDFSATGPFYNGLFGWALQESMPGYMSFGPGRGIGGVFQGHTPAAETVVYVWVDDMQATRSRISANGGKLLGEPGGVPGLGTFAYYTDVEGAVHGLIGR